MNSENVFAALASTPRRKILAYLAKTSLTAGEIAERFDMTKPSLSKHLKILEHAGLIKGEKRGQFIHYSLVDDNLLGNFAQLPGDVLPGRRPAEERERRAGYRQEERGPVICSGVRRWKQ